MRIWRKGITYKKVNVRLKKNPTKPDRSTGNEVVIVKNCLTEALFPGV
jgi:hypothetical protein